MIDYSFIRLKTSLEAAQNLDDSPIVENTYLGQIQLLPEDPKPYFFNSELPIGPNPEVYLVTCKGQKSNISAHFSHITVDGSSAFRLAYLPDDYGQRLVYLEIQSDNTPTYYSNLFKVTREDEHLTSRIDYKFPLMVMPGVASSLIFADYYLSVQLAFYKEAHIDSDEISSYLSVSDGENLLTNSIHTDLIQWLFNGLDSFTHKRLKRALQKGKAYINFIRNNAFEAFEYEGNFELSNMGITTFLTDQDEDDILIVDDVIIATDKQSNWVFVDENNTTAVDGNNLVFLE